MDAMSSGFSPKKVTLNKYGGGGMDIGSTYGGPSAKTSHSHGYRPVSAPAPVAPPAYVPMAAPMSPPSRGSIEFQNQFSAPQRALPTQQSQGRVQIVLFFNYTSCTNHSLFVY